MITAIVIASLVLSVGVLVFVIWNGRQIKRINAETAAIIDRMKAQGRR